MCRVHRLILLFFMLLLISLPSPAQAPTCKQFKVADAQVPVYPPIARAASMSATIRFTVELAANGKAQVSFLDGPSKGVWQMLVKSAHDYLSAREYTWFDGGQPKPCSYVASVEFRVNGKAVEPPNNFFQVTVEDETRTVVEVRPTVPTTVMY